MITDTRTKIDDNYPVNSIMMACNILASGNKGIDLLTKLRVIAIDSLREANKGNPFITKGDTMRDINRIRALTQGIKLS